MTLWRSNRDKTEKETASGRVISNGRLLVQEQRAEVWQVRMQMVLEGDGVIYKTGSST